MEMNRLGLAVAIAALAASIPVSAHHSPSAYDMTKAVEAEGVVVETKVINPHFTMKVKVTNKDGTTEIYDIHGAGKTLLKNTGVDLGEFKPGVKVKVAGNPRKADGHDLLVSNLLGPSGKEILLGIPGQLPKARWAKLSTGGYEAKDLVGVADPAAAKRGIFRVWSAVTYFGDPETLKKIQQGSVFAGGVKLNAAAQASQKQAIMERLKMEAAGTLPDCYEIGMPMIGAPLLSSVEFINKGKTIEQRIDNIDKPRVIHMQESASKPAFDPRLGYSVGRWEGKTLVVKTTDIKFGGMGGMPIPQSEKLVVTERFTPSEDGAKLDYQVTRDDSVYLLEPATTNANWIWRPGRKLDKFSCVETKTAAKQAAAGR